MATTEKEVEQKSETCSTTQSCSTEKQKPAEAAEIQKEKAEEKSKHGGCCGG